MPFLQRNGFRIFYRWDGDERAPVLILSHSLGADHRMWEPQVEMLKTHFHILRYDHPGHGESDVRPHQTSIADFGADVLTLMDHLGIKRANFCGLSLGGMTGLWLGVNAPQRLSRLVISSAAAHFDDTSRLRWRIETIRRDGRLDAITESVLSVWFTPEFRERARMDSIEKMFLATQVEGYAATAETVCELDLRDDLARVSVPTLVIYGSDDHATTPAQNRFLQEAIPGAQAVCVPAAHLANVEAPTDYSNAVRDFLLAPR